MTSKYKMKFVTRLFKAFFTILVLKLCAIKNEVDNANIHVALQGGQKCPNLATGD
jgi:hypothetical protein